MKNYNSFINLKGDKPSIVIERYPFGIIPEYFLKCNYCGYMLQDLTDKKSSDIQEFEFCPNCNVKYKYDKINEIWTIE